MSTVIAFPKGPTVKIPPAKRDWHPKARAWYRSLKKDARSLRFEPSHWEMARILTQLFSDELNLPPEKRSPERVQGYLDALENFG